jgi:hypothetical protein
MPTTTLSVARDDIMTAFKAAVDAYNTANATAYPVFYDDVDKAQTDGKGAHFRVFIKHNLGDQATLGPAGRRQFCRNGVVLVQVMTPFGDGFTLNDALVTVARNAFEGVATPNQVWFRKVSPGKEVGKTGGFQQTNVSANFEYYELR